MDPRRTTIVIGCAIVLAANVGSSSAQPTEPLPRHGISPPRKRCRVKCPVMHPRPGTAALVTLESGWMRHTFIPPTFESTSTVASRGDVKSEPSDHAIATGPHFLIAIDLSRSIYGGVELAAGGLDGPTVIREGVDVSNTGFYIGLRAIAGTRFELGRLSFAVELAPGLNDVSFESPSMRDKRGNPVRFDETAYEVDLRTRFDVRVTRLVAIGMLAGAGLFDRHDLSAAITLRLRHPPR